MTLASSVLPLATNHLGDSGRKYNNTGAITIGIEITLIIIFIMNKTSLADIFSFNISPFLISEIGQLFVLYGLQIGYPFQYERYTLIKMIKVMEK